MASVAVVLPPEAALPVTVIVVRIPVPLPPAAPVRRVPTRTHPATGAHNCAVDYPPTVDTDQRQQSDSARTGHARPKTHTKSTLPRKLIFLGSSGPSRTT